MTEALDGFYYYPGAAHPVRASAGVVPKRILRIEDANGAPLGEFARRQVKVTPRLAALPRRFDLADGARFVCADNDEADRVLRRLRKLRRGRFVDRLQRIWPAVGAALLVTLLAAYYFGVQGLPRAGEWLAARTLPAVAHTVSEQTLMALDRYALTPSALSAADQEKAAKLFARTAAHAQGGAGAYRLVFRGGTIGPNAFALPDGTIVMTDALWPLVKSDAEIEGVFAQEMSHADHAHNLQRVYADSPYPAALATLTGDVSQVSQMAIVLPGIIAQASYTRGVEQQADDDAAATLRAMGEKPSRLAGLLERLGRTMCAKLACRRSWIGDHPDIAPRAARLRLEDHGPLAADTDCLAPWKTGLSLYCLGIGR